MICSCVLAFCLGAIGGSDVGTIGTDAFIGPFGEITDCEYLRAKCNVRDGHIGMPLSIEVFSSTNGGVCSVKKQLFFDGDGVVDWIVGKKPMLNHVLEVSDLPCRNESFVVETNLLTRVGRTVIVSPHGTNLLSVVNIDEETIRKRNYFELGGALKPWVPDVWMGMGLHEERFSYLNYPDEKNISLYMGLYYSSNGLFGLMAIAQTKEMMVLGITAVSGKIRFDDVGDAECVVKRNLFGDKGLDIACNVESTGHQGRFLHFEVTYMGFKNHMCIKLSPRGWEP